MAEDLATLVAALGGKSVQDECVSNLLQCNTCKNFATGSHAVPAVSPFCFSVECATSKCNLWYVCSVCRTRLDRRGYDRHFFHKKHEKALVRAGHSSMPPVERQNLTGIHADEAQDPHASVAVAPKVSTLGAGDPGSLEHLPVPMHVAVDVADNRPRVEDSKLPSERRRAADRIRPAAPPTTLAAAFSSVKPASISALSLSFKDQTNMKLYFAGERVTRFRGVQTVVSCAFHKTVHFGPEQTATVEEALFHMDVFIQ